MYELVAEARDQGTPYRSARVPVRIMISDGNYFHIAYNLELFLIIYLFS